MPLQTDWPPLRVAFDQLTAYEALPQFSAYDAMRAAMDIIGRGDVPATGFRSDIPDGTTRERIEALLKKAKRTIVDCVGDEITAYFDSRQDREIFGPRSRFNDTGPRPTFYARSGDDQAIIFRAVLVRWPALVQALAAAGFALSDETSRRRGAYLGELASFWNRLSPEMRAKLTDDEIAHRFMDHVEAKVNRGQSALKLPQQRHVANQVGNLRKKDSGAR